MMTTQQTMSQKKSETNRKPKNYIPFSLDHLQLPQEEDFELFDDPVWRKFWDSKDVKEIHPAIHNLIASLLFRTHKRKTIEGTALLTLLLIQSRLAIQFLASNNDGLAPMTAKLFLSQITQAVELLNHHAKGNPANYKEFAHVSLVWPALLSPASSLATDPEIIKTLEVGMTSPIRFGKKTGRNMANSASGQTRNRPFHFEGKANKVALRVFQTLLSNRCGNSNESGLDVPEWVNKCRKLPDLSATTIDDWFEVGWDAIRAAYEDASETEKTFLNSIGSSRGGVTGQNQDLKAVMRGIKEKVKEAFKRIVIPNAQRPTNQCEKKKRHNVAIVTKDN